MTAALAAPLRAIRHLGDETPLMQRTLSASVHAGDLPAGRAEEAAKWLDEQVRRCVRVRMTPLMHAADGAPHQKHHFLWRGN